jgi:hypothetical protein
MHYYVIKFFQCLAASQWFCRGTLVSSTNKADRHDITEILLEMALSMKHTVYIKKYTCVSENIQFKQKYWFSNT